MFFVPTIASEIGQAVLLLTAVVAFLILRPRMRTWTREDRDAGIVAFLGLCLCGRYLGLTHSALDWLIVIPLAMFMLKVAFAIGKLPRETRHSPEA